MDAMKNILMLASLIIGLAVTAVLAEEQTDVVFGPEVPTTTEPTQTTVDTNAVPTTETEQTDTTDTDKSAVDVDPRFLVKKISFDGVKTVSEDMLRTLIQTQVDSEVSEELLTKDVKSLYKDTGFFAEVKVDTEPVEGGGLEIIYKVVENPKISGLNIIGNDNLSVGKLKDEITLRPDEIFSDRRRWESEQALRNVYHEKGYYLVGIQTHLDKKKNDDDEETNTVQVTFEINEGPRVRIEEINFIGNENISAKTLEKKLKTRTGKPFDQILFEEEDMSLNLRNYYQDRGFAQVMVVGYEKRFTEDKTGLILDITIDEGPEFVVGTYTLEVEAGAKSLFSENKIRGMLDPAEGEIFNRGSFDESIAKLQQAYLDKGYLLSEVLPTPVFNEADGVVDITLKINEGDIIIIGKVIITGLEKTVEHVVKRELDFLGIKSDELLDVKSLRKARQRLFQMGSFIRAVDFVPSDTAEENRKDLRVNIAETPRTGMLSLGGGYGSEGGIFGTAEVGQNNLLGRAYRVHLKGELGTRDHHTAELSFGTPWVFGTPTRLNARIYNNRRFRRYYGTVGRLLNRSGTDYLYDRYVWSRRGASVTLGRPIAYDVDLSVRLRNEHVEAHNPDEELINRSTRSILFAIGRDTRDYRTSLYDPMGGSSHTLSYEYSGGILGADNEFQKYSLDTSWFYSGWWNHVIAAHARAGYMVSKSSDRRFLFYERFFLGGVDTIRGYEQWEIYPESLNPYGGNKVFFANLEYRIPVSPQLTAALFFDIGQVWDETVSNPFNFDHINMKKGLGVEARLNMFGMLARLGWGYGLDRLSGEPAGKFHFTIGPGF
ncbi:outer membrane protein assembly factor BamA [Candidatus Poribacteria bacterium]|nr:outer membrane protein assembly factor BamA [Candidatus Poribacteria bacterium]